MAGACVTAANQNLRANRQLRYAAPAIRTKDEGHWILLPMSSDTFVPYLPGRSHGIGLGGHGTLGGPGESCIRARAISFSIKVSKLDRIPHPRSLGAAE